MIHPVLFYVLSGLIVASAVGVILARHPLYAVLSLVVTLFSLSALFICLHAFFVAAIQVLIYAGAVLVLFIFVVMLLDMAPEVVFRAKSWTMISVGTALGFLILWQTAAVSLRLQAPSAPGPVIDGTTAAVGRILFTAYALPFEAASLLLLVGIIGAIVLAKKQL